MLMFRQFLPLLPLRLLVFAVLFGPSEWSQPCHLSDVGHGPVVFSLCGLMEGCCTLPG